ncbi:winged helix-turn-helix transcriptional regulator [Massilia atriviolacea]|uniref:Transcriptional regulator n=1 Tax=Massilia atriviolacea TaxID=2495579 RepID=A0A430HQA9_9BURK|nr:helix-turn-helix domain-containing protein [Massilia atriviolacea]RSZ59706.1 transcriptional regulator [Massilia atriviolacea]
MSKRTINFPIDATVILIGGKWKCAILCHLMEGSTRSGQLRRMMFGITQKVLTEQLRELEADGLIAKLSTPGKVPMVEYAVTPLGATLTPIIEAMCNWGQDYLSAHGMDRPD